MRIAVTKPLFAWDDLDDSPTLDALKRLLALIPDGKLMDGLRRARGRGRDDYPVHLLWGVVLLTIALRHVSFEACLEELRRNAGLRRLLGIRCERQVPKKWNISRFLEVLGREPHRSHLREVFDEMAQRLGRVVPDLGRDVAGDATSLNARRKREPAEAAAEVAEGLPQPTGGRKEYQDDEGKVTKVVEWFGYKLHLLVDVKHEVALGYQITSANVGDGETLPAVLAQAQANLPKQRIHTLAYDKAADSHEVHGLLSKAGIKPLIQMRSLWKEESEKMLPGHDGNSNIVYDEAGTIYCYDKVSQPLVRHPMAYTGYEKDRGTLKYRCPAVHEGWTCPSESVCNAHRSFGLSVRVKQEIDLRRFPATSAGHQAVRAPLQGTHRGRAGQRPAQGFLGRRRRQPQRLAPVSRLRRRGDGDSPRLRHALGQCPAPRGNLGQDAPQPDRPSAGGGNHLRAEGRLTTRPVGRPSISISTAVTLRAALFAAASRGSCTAC